MQSKTVLVIEDNPVNMTLIRAILKLVQYRMIETPDAETGIRLARESRPDLMLLDIQLPGMDGLSAGRLIKSDPALKDIPVIAVTGDASEEEKNKAMDIGFFGYIVKPFRIDELLGMIAQALTDRQTQPE